MFRPHWINPTRFLVRINRKEQKKKRESLGESGLLIADTKNTFMQNNMQYGELLMIGTKVEKFLPEAREGDNLIFSHFIEGSIQSYDNKEQDELNNEYLLHQDDDFNYYIVPQHEVFGVEKSDGTIIPTPNHIFATIHKDELEASLERSKGGILLYNGYRDSESELQVKIDDLKSTLQHTNNHDAQVHLTKQMEEYTGRLNAMRFAKFHPVFVNEQFNRDCGRKVTKEDVVYYLSKGANNVKIQPYELKFKGITYCILRIGSVVMVSKDEPLRIQDMVSVVNAQGKLQEQILQ